MEPSPSDSLRILRSRWGRTSSCNREFNGWAGVGRGRQHMVRILGIDPGMGTMGFGLISADDDRDIDMLECGIISTPKKTPVPTRLHILHQDLNTLLTEFQPDWVGIEKLFFYRMGNTILVAQARGVILLALAQHGFTPTEYTPAQIKQALTGYGNADKLAVQEAVTRELRLETIPRPDDAADGLAIALTVWYNRCERSLAVTSA